MRIIIATIALCLCVSAQAELSSPGSRNVTDSDTGLDWRKLSGLEKNGYSTALALYDADSTYRYPTAAEVADLLAKSFPGFVASDASGRCSETTSGVGGYPGQNKQVDQFLNLFVYPGGTIPFRALYEDAGGVLRALYVQRNRLATDTTVCLTGNDPDYESYRDYPYINSIAPMVVRPAMDLTASNLTVFSYLDPGDIGLFASTSMQGNPEPPQYEAELGGHDDNHWVSNTVYCIPPFCQDIYGSFSFGAFPSASNYDRRAPWVRVKSLEYTGPCTTGDADIGGGWCRRTFVDSEFQFTGAPVSFPGTYIDNRGTVDNIEIEQILENVKVDFDPWQTENTILPKNIGWTIYIEIETTSIADGDAYDFDAADVDPATLMTGPGLASVVDYGANDIDGDGDTDYIFKFVIGDTGVGCLDHSITISGRTYSGDPITGRDSITTAGCTEAVDIDVDPFNPVNTIRPNDDYNVTVAVLGMRVSAGDAIDLLVEGSYYNTDVLDADTLRLGPAATPAVGTPIITDVDGDSFDDMLVNFNVFDAGIACDDTELEVVGNKKSGLPIKGIDAIVTEDCDTATCHP